MGWYEDIYGTSAGAEKQSEPEPTMWERVSEIPGAIKRGIIGGYTEPMRSLRRGVGADSEEEDARLAELKAEREEAMSRMDTAGRIGMRVAEGIGGMAVTLPLDIAIGKGILTGAKIANRARVAASSAYKAAEAAEKTKMLTSASERLDWIPNFAAGMGAHEAADKWVETGDKDEPFLSRVAKTAGYGVKGFTEGMIFHKMGGFGKGMSPGKQLAAQTLAVQPITAMGIAAEDSLIREGRLPTLEEYAVAAGSGATIGGGLGLAGARGRWQMGKKVLDTERARLDKGYYELAQNGKGEIIGIIEDGKIFANGEEIGGVGEAGFEDIRPVRTPYTIEDTNRVADSVNDTFYKGQLNTLANDYKDKNPPLKRFTKDDYLSMAKDAMDPNTESTPESIMQSLTQQYGENKLHPADVWKAYEILGMTRGEINRLKAEGRKWDALRDTEGDRFKPTGISEEYPVNESDLPTTEEGAVDANGMPIDVPGAESRFLMLNKDKALEFESREEADTFAENYGGGRYEVVPYNNMWRLRDSGEQKVYNDPRQAVPKEEAKPEPAKYLMDRNGNPLVFSSERDAQDMRLNLKERYNEETALSEPRTDAQGNTYYFLERRPGLLPEFTAESIPPDTSAQGVSGQQPFTSPHINEPAWIGPDGNRMSEMEIARHQEAWKAWMGRPKPDEDLDAAIALFNQRGKSNVPTRYSTIDDADPLKWTPEEKMKYLAQQVSRFPEARDNVERMLPEWDQRFANGEISVDLHKAVTKMVADVLPRGKGRVDDLVAEDGAIRVFDPANPEDRAFLLNYRSDQYTEDILNEAAKRGAKFGAFGWEGITKDVQSRDRRTIRLSNFADATDAFHEAFHNIARERGLPNSEKLADDFANAVIEGRMEQFLSDLEVTNKETNMQGRVVDQYGQVLKTETPINDFRIKILTKDVEDALRRYGGELKTNAPKIENVKDIETIGDLQSFARSKGVPVPKDVRADYLEGAMRSMPSTSDFAKLAWIGRNSKNWYPHDYKNVVKLIGNKDDAVMLKKLWAVTSQGSDATGVNLAVGLEIFKDYKNRPKRNSEGMEKWAQSIADKHVVGVSSQVIRQQVVNAIMGRPLSGAKINDAYLQNLLGDYSKATIDRWMGVIGNVLAYNHFVQGGKDKMQLGYNSDIQAHGNSILMALMQDRITQAAKQLGWKPAEVQSATWSLVKALEQKIGPMARKGSWLEAFQNLTQKDIGDNNYTTSLIQAVRNPSDNNARLRKAIDDLGLTQRVRSLKTMSEENRLNPDQPLLANIPKEYADAIAKFGESTDIFKERRYELTETNAMARRADIARPETLGVQMNVETSNSETDFILNDAQKQSMHKEMMDILVKSSKRGGDYLKIANDMGANVIKVEQDMGQWEDNGTVVRNPVLKVFFATPDRTIKGGVDAFDTNTYKAIDGISAYLQFTLRQAGIGRLRPRIATDVAEESIVYVRSTGGKFSKEEQTTLTNSLKKTIDGKFYIAPAEEGVYVVNTTGGKEGWEYSNDSFKTEVLRAVDETVAHKTGKVLFYENEFGRKEGFYSREEADLRSAISEAGGSKRYLDAVRVRSEQDAIRQRYIEEARAAGRGSDAVAPAERGVAGEESAQAGQYRIREAPKGIEAVGIHYSKEQRPVLSSSFYGTGYAGAERLRLPQSKNSPLNHRIYTYVNTFKSGKFKPEAGVGSHAHEVRMTNLYDPESGKLDIKVRAGENPMNAFELAVIKAGYDGYISRDNGVAILLGNRDVVPKYLGEQYDTSKTPRVADAILPKEALVQRELDANKKLPQGLLSGKEWVDVLKGKTPQLYGTLDEMGVIAGLKKYRGNLSRKDITDISYKIKEIGENDKGFPTESYTVKEVGDAEKVSQNIQTKLDEGLAKSKDILSGKPSPVPETRFKQETQAVLNQFKEVIKQPQLGWLERMVASPEWYQHEGMSKLYDLFTHEREDLKHKIFHDNEAIDPTKPIGPENSIIKVAEKLRDKGISMTDKMRSKTSKEYQELARILTYGDAEYKRDLSLPYDQQVEKFKKHVTEQMQQKGFSEQQINEILTTWGHFRKSYDSYLQLMIEPMKNMRDKIRLTYGDDKSGATQALRDLEKNLTYMIVKMNSWKGFYAPRERENLKYVLHADKGEEGTDFRREHIGSKYSLTKREQELRSQGYNVESGEYKRMPESVFAGMKKVNLASLLKQSVENLKADNPEAAGMLTKLEKGVLEQAIMQIQARGFMRAKMARDRERHVKGYEEDPINRFLMYARNTSGGISKGEVARKAYEILGSIKPTEDPVGYETANKYVDEQLRNVEAADRAVALAKSVATFKYLGFNFRSAFVNTTAVATTAPAAIMQYATDGKVHAPTAIAALGKAGVDFGRFMASKGKAKVGSAEDQKFLTDIMREHYDTPQYTNEIMDTLRSKPGQLWGKAVSGSMWFFGTTEKWNRGTTLLAAFRLARRNGFDYETAKLKARDATEKAHGVYGKTTLPEVAQGTGIGARVLQSFYAYSKFGHNYVQMLYDLGARKHNIEAFAYGLLSPVLLAGTAALPFKDNIVDGVESILKATGAIDDRKDLEKWFWDKTRKELGSDAEALGRHGILGTLGADISSSLSFGAAWPQSWEEVLGPAGGVVKDIKRAKQFAASGEPGRALESALPTAFANVLRGKRESEQGVRTTKGYPVFDESGRPYKYDTKDAAIRMAGFRPTKQAVLSERQTEAIRETKGYEEERNQIIANIRAWIATPDKTANDFAPLRERIIRFNKSIVDNKLQGQVSPITRESISRQQKNMVQPNKKEMIRLRQQQN